MKINGNSKNNSHSKVNEPTTDQLSKKAVEVADDIPVKNFDPNQTWLKISARLGQLDKRFVTWGLAMAASFSLLVAANLTVPEWNLFQTEPKHILQAEIIPAQHVIKEEVADITIQPVALTSIQHVSPIAPVALDNEPVVVTAVPSAQKTILVTKINESQKVNLRPFSNPFISVYAKANFQSEGFSPELGIDFKLAEDFTAKRRNIYKLGISSQFDMISNEANESKIHPHTFVNLEFVSLNKQTGKGWTARSGYLLNPDGKLYQDTTIKVSLLRNFGKYIKVGPEMIFTDNFKKTYPAISLILG